MTVKLKQDRTRRSGYKGSLNAQDWPKEKQVLDRLALAQSNITNAEISLEIAAGCLKRAEKAGAWTCVFTALQSLKEAQAALQEKPKKEVTVEVER
jgi:hypothetical protein